MTEPTRGLNSDAMKAAMKASSWVEAKVVTRGSMKVAATENWKVAKRVARRGRCLASTMELAKGSSLVATMGPMTVTAK